MAIVRHVYRPFDVRWIYWEPTTRLLGEKSGEYIEHHFGSLQIIAQQKPRAASDAPQAAYAQISLDLIDRGASIFPQQTVEVVDVLTRQLEVRPNISNAAHVWLNAKSAEHRQLFLHALATMHTPQYRASNEGALLSDWPRIPLPATAELLTHSATLGSRLARCV